MQLRYALVSSEFYGGIVDYKVVDTHGDPAAPPVFVGTVREAVEGRCADLNAAWLVKERQEIADTLSQLAELRAPLTMADITPDLCNFPDRVIEGEVRALMDRYNTIDVSDLADDDGNQDVETWEHVAGGPEPFEVRAVPDPSFEPNDVDDEYPEVYQVVDTDSDDVAETFDDESDAENDRDERNREYREENLHGFPFAHNYAVEIERFEVEDFADAGFLVYEYRGDKLIAGIDGGGYSFMGQHWSRVFHAKAVRGGWKVETSTGPRRVA